MFFLSGLSTWSVEILRLAKGRPEKYAGIHWRHTSVSRPTSSNMLRSCKHNFALEENCRTPGRAPLWQYYERNRMSIDILRSKARLRRFLALNRSGSQYICGRCPCLAFISSSKVKLVEARLPPSSHGQILGRILAETGLNGRQ